MIEILTKVWGAAATWKKQRGKYLKVDEIHCWEFDEEEKNKSYVWKSLCKVDRLSTSEVPPMELDSDVPRCKKCEKADG